MRRNKQLLFLATLTAASALALTAESALVAQDAAQTAAPTAKPAADITGIWRGSMDFGGDQPYPVVIHVTKGQDGKLTTWGENPQDGSNIPGDITFQDGKVHLSWDAGTYDGTVNDAADTITGSFVIQGTEIPCQLKKDKAGAQ